MDTNIKDMEDETKAKRTPTPQLNQACHTRRDFEAKVDLHETTQGERYLTAMVINPTIKYDVRTWWRKECDPGCKE